MFDILILGDMTRTGDIGLRVAQEVRLYDEMGYRVGLMHINTERSRSLVPPELQKCIRNGIGEVLDPSWRVEAALAIVHTPRVLSEFPEQISAIKADRVLLVHDRPPDEKQMGRWFGLLFGKMLWVPTNRWVRASIDRLGIPAPMEEEDWRPIAKAPSSGLPPIARKRQRIVIGRTSALQPSQWPKKAEELALVFPTDGSMDVMFLGGPPKELMPRAKGPSKWTILDHGSMSTERFIDLIDVFAYFPGGEIPELPDAAIAYAMATGKIVVLPPRLRPHFGPGAIYAEPQNAISAITALFADEAELAKARDTAAFHAAFQFSEARHRERIAELVGPRDIAPPAFRPQRIKRKARALFVPSNGVGLGHVTRLLAVARRADGLEPIFATMAQAVAVIESFGYATEYLPSRTDTGAGPAAWDLWLRTEMARLIAGYDARLVVFDGNNLYSGLIRAAMALDCRLAWIRRGMQRATATPLIEGSRYCDLIIEPGEIAAERDIGPTSKRRDEVALVTPICLLDEDELLSRADAMRELQLKEDQPAVLVHLGAGATRDLIGLVDRVVEQLRNFTGLQIVIAEWANAQAPLVMWPGVTRLRGFPLSRYFNAFDFSISAGGYNSFHEVINFGLPTVFVANTHPSLDDQAARAQYAQEFGAGLDVPESELFHLPAICEVLLNERAREEMRKNCRRIRQTNGARQAAALLEELVHA